jgi:hypothetical protein
MAILDEPTNRLSSLKSYLRGERIVFQSETVEIFNSLYRNIIDKFTIYTEKKYYPSVVKTQAAHWPL